MLTVRNMLVVVSLALSVIIGLVIARGGGSTTSGGGVIHGREIHIGLSMDTLKEARWQNDRDLFIASCNALGAVADVESANSDDTQQIKDVESLLTSGVNVLVLVPHDGLAMAKAVDMAHKAGIPVIAYDRLIQNCDLDLYLSFDNVRVGEQQAQYLVDHLPTPGKGNIVRIFGAPTDNNAKLYKQGQDIILKPYIDRGDIKIIHEDWAEDWRIENAKKIMNAAITNHGHDFVGVLAANDGTAGGAIQALTEEGLAGKVLVTGQDAELPACQRIVDGTQAMTVYKPVKKLAQMAAEMAVKMARGKPIIANASVNNGKIDVPSVLIDTVAVSKDNMMGTVVKDGFHSYDEVYRDVPENQRPPKPQGRASHDPIAYWNIHMSTQISTSQAPRMSGADGAPILQAQQIIKRFPGVVALKGVSFDLRPGEIHGICGENGAGKSTLIKVLSGIHPFGSYEGDLFLRGSPLQMENISDAERNGIAVIYQELALVSQMTVAENIFLGCEPTRHGLIDWLTVFAVSRELLQHFGLEISPTERIGNLGIGHQQLVEIVKALAKKSRILILDEPTAALSESEVQILLNILRDLRKSGISCIYISHKLDEVFAIADRITVLRDGQSIITTDTAGTNKNEVIRYMVGREITELYPRHASHPGKVRLSVKNLAVANPDNGPGSPGSLRGISFDVRQGEVLGIGGLMGAGRTELLMHLFGAWGKRISGTVELNGQPLDDPSPAHSINAGLVLVSEDRKRYGLIVDQTIGFNLSLSSLKEVASGGRIDPNLEFKRNQEMFESLRIKAPNLEANVGKLSGGNQQKVVLGKALLTNPQVIFLDEPTRGIDVGAKVEVYQLINRLTEQGQAVVLVSSELPELMGMSDRILMLHEGTVGGLINRADSTQEKLMAAAMGHAI